MIITIYHNLFIALRLYQETRFPQTKTQYQPGLIMTRDDKTHIKNIRCDSNHPSTTLTEVHLTAVFK